MSLIQEDAGNFEPISRMGQLLSEPITKKETTSLETEAYKVASSAMQGWRTNMEDAHCHFIPLEEDPSASFFGVFDGHGGDRVARHVRECLHQKIIEMDAYKKGDIPTALQEGFVSLDWEMMDNPSFKVEMSGSTGIVLLIKDETIYCGNIGDSRAIASVSGEVRELSQDHKPTKKAEQERILEAGGWVEMNRVNGNLALSRAFGDFGYKNRDNPPEQQVISAYPEIRQLKVTEDIEFVLIACDGIWDCLKNNQVLDFVRSRIGKGEEPSLIVEELMDHCLAPVARPTQTGTDNMTAILITFLHNKPYAALIDRCSSVSDTQLQARKGLTLEDILNDSDDEDAPPLPSRPDRFMRHQPLDEDFDEDFPSDKPKEDAKPDNGLESKKVETKESDKVPSSGQTETTGTSSEEEVKEEAVTSKET